MSKIEIECSICQAILRVDSRHAGKQARCPGCGGLTLIPSDGTGDQFAVPAPPSANLPFNEPFYRDSPTDSMEREQADSPEAVYSPAANVDESNDYRYLSEPRSHPQPYQPGESAPLHGDRLVIQDDIGNPGSIAAGVIAIAIIMLCLPTIPMCFCITPFGLLLANSISRKAPNMLQQLAFGGILVVGGVWAIRTLIFFLAVIS